MSTNIPAQPEAPDYAAANREGIYTDIDTLPIRRQIDQASRLGQVVTYIDPQTGQERTADFRGLGDITLARQAADLASQTNADIQRQQLLLRQELGTANAAQTAAEIRAADPLAYDTRQELTQRLREAMNAGPTDTTDAQSRDRLGSIYDDATRLPTTVNDESTAALNLGLQRAVADYQLGGALDPNVKRQLLDEVRAGQVARGNYFGDAAAVAEATEVGSAMEQRAAQRLATLLGVQQQAFGQNSAMRQERNALAQQRLGTLAQLQGQQFAQNQSQRNEAFGRQQQNLANVSAMVLGQPITNQFGSLGSAQQGAVAYNPVGYSGGPALNANAGALAAQFAQGNYGTMANMWSTAANIAQQDNAGKMGLISGLGGAALGAMI